MKQVRPMASVTTLHIDSFDPAIMQETVRGAAFEHTQLARGRFRARLLSAQLEKQRLDCGRYNLPLHARGPMPDTHVTLGFVLNGEGPAVFNGYEIARPTPVVLSERTELDYRMAPGSEWLAFQVKRESLERVGIVLRDQLNDIIDIRPHDQRQLRHHMLRAIAGLNETVEGGSEILVRDAFCDNQIEGIFDAFCAALQCNTSQQPMHPHHPKHLHRLAKRAVDYFDAHYGDTIHIGLICDELGTSWKTLQRAFSRLYGTTPKRYLDFLRLAKARRLLLSHESKRSVAEIAGSCGITHLGRFAQLYRDTYGESPSETTGRSNRRLRDAGR